MTTIHSGIVTSSASNRGQSMPPAYVPPPADCHVPPTPQGSPRRDDDRSDLSTFICADDEINAGVGVPSWPSVATLQDLLTALHDNMCAPRPANGAFVDVVNYGDEFYLKYATNLTQLIGDSPACGLYEYVWGAQHDLLRRLARASMSSQGDHIGSVLPPPLFTGPTLGSAWLNMGPKLAPPDCPRADGGSSDACKPAYFKVGSTTCVATTVSAREELRDVLVLSSTLDGERARDIPTPDCFVPGLHGGSRPRTVDVYTSPWYSWSPGNLSEALSSSKFAFYEWVLTSPVLLSGHLELDLNGPIHVQSLPLAGVHEFSFSLRGGGFVRVPVCLAESAGYFSTPFELPDEIVCNACLSASSQLAVSTFVRGARCQHVRFLQLAVPHVSTCRRGVKRQFQDHVADLASAANAEDPKTLKLKRRKRLHARLSTSENEGTSGVVNVMPVAEVAAAQLTAREKTLLQKYLKQHLLGIAPAGEIVGPAWLSGETGFDYIKAMGQVNYATPIFNAADWPNPATTSNPNLPSAHPFRVVNNSYPNLTEGLIMTNCPDGSWLLGAMVPWLGNTGSTTIGSTSITFDTWAGGQLSVDYGINQTIFVPAARFYPALRSNNMVAYTPLHTSLTAQVAVQTVYSQMVVGGAVIHSPTGVNGFHSLGLNAVNPNYWPVTAAHIVAGNLRNPITERGGESSALSSASLSCPCSVAATTTNTTPIPIMSMPGALINYGLSLPGQNGSIVALSDVNFTSLTQFNNGQAGSGQAVSRGVPTFWTLFTRNGALVAGAEMNSFIGPLAVSTGGTGAGLGKNAAICEFTGSNATVSPTVGGMVGPGYGFLSKFVGVPIRVHGQVTFTADLATAYSGVQTDLTKLRAFMRIYTPQLRPDDATWSIAANFRDIPLAMMCQNQGAGTPMAVDGLTPATATTRVMHSITIDETFVALSPIQRVVIFTQGTVGSPALPAPPRAGVGANGVTVDASVRFEVYGDCPPQVVRRDVGIVPGSRVVGTTEMLALGFVHPAILNTRPQLPIDFDSRVMNVASQLSFALMSATSHVVLKKIDEHEQWRQDIAKTIENAAKYEAGWADILNTILRTATSVMSGLMPHTTHQPVTPETFARRRKAGFVEEVDSIQSNGLVLDAPRRETVAHAEPETSNTDDSSTLRLVSGLAPRRRLPPRRVKLDQGVLEAAISDWNASHEPLTPEELSKATTLLTDGSASDIKCAFIAVRYPMHAGGFATFPTIVGGVPSDLESADILSTVFGVLVEPVSQQQIADDAWRSSVKFCVDRLVDDIAVNSGRFDDGFEPTSADLEEFANLGLTIAVPLGLKSDVEVAIDDVVDYLSIVRGHKGVYKIRFTRADGQPWGDYRSLDGRSFMAALIAAFAGHQLDKPITGGFEIHSRFISEKREMMKSAIESSIVFDKYDVTSLLVKSTHDTIKEGVRPIYYLTSDHPDQKTLRTIADVNRDGVRVVHVSLRDILTKRHIAGRGGRKSKEKIEIVEKVVEVLDPPTAGSSSGMQKSRRQRKKEAKTKQDVADNQKGNKAQRSSQSVSPDHVTMKEVRRLLIATFKASLKYLNGAPA